MTDDIVRKMVTPAHERASIPDPSHPGMDVAPSGTWVVWDAYWIARFNRGEILIVGDTTEDVASPASEPQIATPPAA